LPQLPEQTVRPRRHRLAWLELGLRPLEPLRQAQPELAPLERQVRPLRLELQGWLALLEQPPGQPPGQPQLARQQELRRLGLGGLGMRRGAS
jgi:hypothetical protein